ncbi:hypothetical protein QBC43DRAFT_291806 [Cladorrhinum sp. PSN259]|nr:hypothetical protein QBC43DRAFT_291806 [Cladorrhinum sp. PSN259]
MGPSSPILNRFATPRSRSSSIRSTIIVSDGAPSRSPSPKTSGCSRHDSKAHDDDDDDGDFSDDDDDDDDIPFHGPPLHRLPRSIAALLHTSSPPQALSTRPHPTISLLPNNVPPLHGHHKIIDRYHLPVPIPPSHHTNRGATPEDRTNKKAVYYVRHSITGRRRFVPYHELFDYVTPRELERWEADLERIKKQSEHLEAVWKAQWEEEDTASREKKAAGHRVVMKRETRSMRKSTVEF